MKFLGLDWFGAKEPDLKFSPFGINNLPPEMRQGMMPAALAPRISRSEALQVPAVLRSRNLIAGSLASLPVHLRNSNRQEVTGTDAPTTLFDQVDPDCPNVVEYAFTYEDLFFEGIAWWRVLERNFAGWPTYAERIHPSRVTVDGYLQISSNVYQGDPGGVVRIDGYPVDPLSVIRFDSPNPPFLVHAARAIRTCLTLDMTASTYADYPVPLGYLTPREGTRPNEAKQKIEDLLNEFEEGRRRHKWAYISAALEAKTLQFNAEQIQLADQRQHAVLEIARAAGIDPEDLGVSTTSRTYQNAEQRRLDLLDFTLRPYMAAVEQRLSMRDVTPRGYYVRANLDAFLRSDTKTRYETYQIADAVGLLTSDEMRELEDRPDLTAAQKRELEPPAPPQLTAVPNEEVPVARAR